MKKRTGWLALASTAPLLLTVACSPSLNLATHPIGESVAILTSPVHGQDEVPFGKPVVRVKEGRISDVEVRSATTGDEVGGELTRGGRAWEPDSSDMEFGTDYEFTATAVDRRGQATSLTGEFTTFTPSQELTMWTNVDDGSTYGVGMPIEVTFNEPVANRASVEERLVVTSNAETEIVGSWSWDSDTSVSYRPKEYWPANTKVRLDARLKGVHAGNDVYGLQDASRKIKIGPANIMLVDAEDHDMTFKRNGRLIRTFPVSTGKPGDETRSGIKVIMSKERNVIFTADVAESDPEYYRIPIETAMRITWSGEYLHSAPWSVGDQGNRNVSHGCVNLSPADSEWLMQNVNIGDVVEVVNSGREQDLGNGITVWNESWKDWTAGSAL